MNVITLTGNAVKDIELRYTPNGKAVGNGTIAVRRDFKNQNGEYESDFINFVALGKTGEIMANHIHKGDKFGITGRLQIRKWESDGGTKYFTEVVVNGFDFPSKRDNSQGNTNTSGNNSNSHTPHSNANNDDPFANGRQNDISDDDLPF